MAVVTVCSSPDCRATAVLQWQRAATDLEAARWHAAATEGQQKIVNYQRGQARLELVELRGRLERVRAAAEGGDMDARVVIPLAEEAVAAAQAKLDGIPDPTPSAGGDVVIAVFGCDEHRVDDEHAAVLHEPVCVAGSCACRRP